MPLLALFTVRPHVAAVAVFSFSVTVSKKPVHPHIVAVAIFYLLVMLCAHVAVIAVYFLCVYNALCSPSCC